MASRLAKIAGIRVTDHPVHFPTVVLAPDDFEFLLTVCRAASKVRLAQRAYYKHRGVNPDEKKSLLIASKEAESELDKLLATQVDDGGQGTLMGHKEERGA